MSLHPPSHEAQRDKAAAGHTDYVCPMHPEIVRSEPGSCPICGMALEPKVSSAGDAPNPEFADMKRRFWVSLVLTIPILIAAMGEMIPGQPLRHLASQRNWTWVEFILASPVVLWGGWPFFVRGWQSIVEYCQFFAKSDREMATALHEMAAAHEEMAKEAAK